MANHASAQTENQLKAARNESVADNLWIEKTDLIKGFIDRRVDYEKLGAEVAYILNRN